MRVHLRLSEQNFIFIIKIVTYWWWKCLFIQNYASSNLNVNMKINYHIQLSRHDLSSKFFSLFFLFLVVHRVESFKIKILEVIKKKICGILSIYIFFLLISSFHSHLCACDRHREWIKANVNVYMSKRLRS